MGLTEPVEIKYDEKHGWWYIQRGKETFYDEDDRLHVFTSADLAAEFCRDVLGVEVNDAGG